jgi:dienelactone hydrolase
MAIPSDRTAEPGSARNRVDSRISTTGHSDGRVLRNAIFAAAAVLCTGGFGLLRAQTLRVIPDHTLVDESATIRASGLQPNERIVISAELTDGGGERWMSQAQFIADAQGNVDTSAQAPVGGSYKEVSAMGLVWSMMPADKKAGAYRAMRIGAAQAIEFALLRDGKQAFSAELQQAILADGVQRVILNEQGLHGILFLPAANGRHPGVLVLGGSEGGMPLERAAWLADRGYAALALAYFRYEDLPRDLEAIPLEYFQRALNWMVRRPEIESDRIAVMGGSRGGELALQLGSMFPQIRAVVAYVPANTLHAACCGSTKVPYAWTWQGTPLAYISLRTRQQPEVVMRATIPVERIHGPVLMISAEDDHVWNSSEMADDVVGRLKSTHFAYSVENLKYPHAGHAAGRPEIVPTWRGEVTHPVSGQEMDLGGSAKGDAESSVDAIPKVLGFLKRNLQDLTAQP